jgi:hypothetical protein
VKVFISWSGDVSHQVAEAFNEWLPLVFQSVVPFFSADNIEKGTRWSQVVARELESSSVGLFCVTPENLDSRWLNFEAGAISKALGEAPERPRVMPFLFGIKKSEVQWPLADFQMTVNDKGDILKLIQSVNRASGNEALDETRLLRSFEMWWPQLEETLSNLVEALDDTTIVEQPSQPVSQEEILEELLELAREQSRSLTVVATQLRAQPTRRSVPIPRGNMLDLMHAWESVSDEMLDELLWNNVLLSEKSRKSLTALAVEMDQVFRTIGLEAYGEKQRIQTTNLISELSSTESADGSADDALQVDLGAASSAGTVGDVPWDDSEPPF